MELRGCAARHFIQTIRRGVVIKIPNISSCRRPAVRFKSLKDIYENEDAKRAGRPSGLMVDHEQVKWESPCSPVGHRTLQEINPKNDEFVPCANDAVDSDLDDDTTLKQLRKRFKTKKRKYSPSDEKSEMDKAYENSVENEPDLNEPLIYWKSRCSKNSKAKKKRMKISVASSLTTAFAIKSQQNLVSEGSPQFGAESSPVICVKVEIPDTDQLGCQNKTSSSDDSPIGHNEVLNAGNLTSNEFENMVLCEYREPLMSVHDYQNCAAAEASWDDFEDVMPIAMLLPWDGMTAILETMESEYENLLDFSPLTIKNREENGEAHSCKVSRFEDQTSDGYGHSRSSSNLQSSEQGSSGIQVPDIGMKLQQEFNLILFEDKAKADSPHEQDDSLSIPENNSGFYPDSVISLKNEHNVVLMEDHIADVEQPSTCSLDGIMKNGLSCGSPIEDESPKADCKQISTSSCIDPESLSSLKNQTCDSADELSTPESRQSPERLLSTRQAISPSSQERLCLAMNCVELSNENVQYKRKEQLFGKPTGKNVSPVISETHQAKNHGRPGQFSQRKVIISPRNIIKKSQIAKGNLEGPRFSRKLPNLNTGCASIQGCSESAIAFSQRQMHDMESLAVKLVNELKSMKDIVEQKLLFEAYRNVSLKNDADEVKSAINSATKVEEMAKKWMSIMTRDCNRFCKIMKMTPNSSAAPKDPVPRGRKKIVFADEAGGKLCHVKVLDDLETFPCRNHTKN